MIRLRRLKTEDAIGMLEWINDIEINQFFTFAYRKFDMASVLQFINEANKTEVNHHYAVVDEEDIYLGTISLKNVDHINRHAEYAIAMRKSMQGQGNGETASRMILDVAKYELKLHKVYLNVLTHNTVAIHLYEKIGFKQKGIYEDHVLKQDGYHDLFYYEIIFSEDTP